MTPEHRDRAKELFADAIDLKGGALDAFVTDVRQSEPSDVVTEFEQLLADYKAAEAAGFLDSPAAHETAVDNEATVAEGQARPSDTIEFISGESLAPRRGDSDRPGPLLADDYEILDEIGKGGMGTVYRAYQLSLRRHVAVKIIPTNLIRSPEEAARFYIEAEAAAKLEHPGIVQVQDVGERNGVHYYTMALVTGGSLSDFVGKEKRLTRQRAAEVIEGVSRAVQYAHDRAVIHRDIKPANILLDGEGNPRLTDFGLAKLVNTDDHLTMTGQVMGTPSYMAPEQAEGDSHAVSNRTDVYSLGATLYALLSGKAPFSGETLFSTLQQVQKSAPAPLPSSVPIDLRTICNKCLEKDPNDRYQSAGQLADDLRNYLDGFPISARRVGRVQRAMAWARRNPMDATLIGTIAAVLVLFGAVSAGLYLRAEWALAREKFQSREVQRAISETFESAGNELLIDVPGMQKIRRQFLEVTRDYYETQLETNHLPPDKVAIVRTNLGVVDALLGDSNAAKENYDRAISLYESQLKDTPTSAEPDKHWDIVQALAQVHREYSNLAQEEMTLSLDQRDAEEFADNVELFAKHAMRSADLRQETADAYPDNYELQRKSANGKMNLAVARIEQYGISNQDDLLSEAEHLILQAQETRLSIKDKHEQPSRVMFDLAKGHQSIAEIHQIRAASADESESASELHAALQQQIQCVNALSAIPADSQNRETENYLALSLQNLGNTYHQLGSEGNATRSFEEMLKIRERLLLKYPGVSEYRIGAARAHFNLSVHFIADNEADSYRHFRQCQEVLAQGPQVEPDDAEPVELLIDFTKLYTDELLKGGLRKDAISHIQYGGKLLNDLPETSRNLEYVATARSALIEMLRDIEDDSQDESV